ncbi:ABC transporter CDR4 [Talaromyces pinophilus]|nr:ABC transporter CDR4 [Talaromyces pinophilus]
MDSSNADAAFQNWLQRQQKRKRLQLGVSFRNLKCHGFTYSSTFQHTVLSYAIVLPRLIARWLSGQEPQRVQILRNFDGVVHAGEMLLVLGRPGSGCSSLLKILSGDTHGIHIGEQTKVDYAGLSLGQTLTFAALARDAGGNSDARSRATGHDIAASFALLPAFDTKIGNAMIRGVSGGEKRRTSIAEALINNSQLQCWDNSTRGLDSSTARCFIELLRRSTNAFQSTAIMSIYQASEAMYHGRQIYFDPVESAANYFIELGFARPSRATTADFLTSITNPAERLIRPGYENRVPRLPDEFAAVWKQSSEAGQLMNEIDAFDSAHPLQQLSRNEAISAATYNSIFNSLVHQSTRRR